MNSNSNKEECKHEYPTIRATSFATPSLKLECIHCGLLKSTIENPQIKSLGRIAENLQADLESSKGWEEFDKWWSEHDDIMGGLSSNLVPKLKQFIQQTLDERTREILEMIPDGVGLDDWANYLPKLKQAIRTKYNL